ncbi:hypothetical protein D3C72_985810 [compost metagenome]
MAIHSPNLVLPVSIDLRGQAGNAYKAWKVGGFLEWRQVTVTGDHRPAAIHAPCIGVDSDEQLSIADRAVEGHQIRGVENIVTFGVSGECRYAGPVRNAGVVDAEFGERIGRTDNAGDQGRRCQHDGADRHNGVAFDTACFDAPPASHSHGGGKCSNECCAHQWHWRGAAGLRVWNRETDGAIPLTAHRADEVIARGTHVERQVLAWLDAQLRHGNGRFNVLGDFSRSCCAGELAGAGLYRSGAAPGIVAAGGKGNRVDGCTRSVLGGVDMDLVVDPGESLGARGILNRGRAAGSATICATIRIDIQGIALTSGDLCKCMERKACVKRNGNCQKPQNPQANESFASLANPIKNLADRGGLAFQHCRLLQFLKIALGKLIYLTNCSKLFQDPHCVLSSTCPHRSLDTTKALAFE